MIIKINNTPHGTTDGSTVGMWLKSAQLNLNVDNISEAFTKHKSKFKDSDLLLWNNIATEIKNENGFWLNEKRQKWFNELEEKYNH